MLLNTGAVPVLCHDRTASTAKGNLGEASLGKCFQQAHGSCCKQCLEAAEVQEREEL